MSISHPITLALALVFALISPVPLFSTPPFPFPCSLFFPNHTHLHITILYQQFASIVDCFVRRGSIRNIKSDAIDDSDSNWTGAGHTQLPRDCSSQRIPTADLLDLQSLPPNLNPLDPACENQIFSARSCISLHGMTTPPSITLNQLNFEPKACAWSETL